jgi:hypothetical protein
LLGVYGYIYAHVNTEILTSFSFFVFFKVNVTYLEQLIDNKNADELMKIKVSIYLECRIQRENFSLIKSVISWFYYIKVETDRRMFFFLE